MYLMCAGVYTSMWAVRSWMLNVGSSSWVYYTYSRDVWARITRARSKAASEIKWNVTKWNEMEINELTLAAFKNAECVYREKLSDGELFTWVYMSWCEHLNVGSMLMVVNLANFSLFTIQEAEMYQQIVEISMYQMVS